MDKLNYRIDTEGRVGGGRRRLKSFLPIWTPSHGRTGVGRPARTYQQFYTDTGCGLEDLPEAMY